MLADSGSDWKRVKVMRVDADGSTTELPDTIEYVRYSGLTWSEDGLGFFYSGCA
jgi:prolyl oligopeptidase